MLRSFQAARSKYSRSIGYDRRLTKRTGKPAITGSAYVFVSKTVPVILTKRLPGLGMEGEVVAVKRGKARRLIEGGAAMWGTTWSNIDEFASPEHADGGQVKVVEGSRVREPFDWIQDLKISLTRRTRDSAPETLVQPVTVWEILSELSKHELDLLPSQVSIVEPLNTVGVFDVTVSLPLRVGLKRFPVRVAIVSKREMEEKERRRLELEKAMTKKTSFVIGTREGAAANEEEEEDEEDDEEDPEAGE